MGHECLTKGTPKRESLQSDQGTRCQQDGAGCRGMGGEAERTGPPFPGLLPHWPVCVHPPSLAPNVYEGYTVGQASFCLRATGLCLGEHTLQWGEEIQGVNGRYWAKASVLRTLTTGEDQS